MTSTNDLAPKQAYLTEWAARQRLREWGITGSPCLAAHSAGEAVAAAEQLGYPVAVKLHSSTILHKTEAGGVRLDLRTPEAVREAFTNICEQAMTYQPGAVVEGVLVQPFLTEGTDLFIGAARDPTFGPYLLVGLGGIWVEVLEDVEAVALPATEADVLRALERLRGAPLLKGIRGRPAVDRAAFAKIAVDLGRFMQASPDVAEVDLNPVRVLAEGSGALLLDARMTLVRGDEPVAAAELSPSQEHNVRARPTQEQIEALLNPRGILVVGASADENKFGSRLVRAIRRHGYGRPIWALHPRGGQVQGIPAFARVSELPGQADLAFITVAHELVTDVIRECGAHGVKTAVIFTSGYSEAGPEGEVRQKALEAAAAAAGICLVGPNTAGVISQDASLYGSFIGTMEMTPVPDGNVALITQSGSVGSFLLGRGWERNLGIRTWVATGDEAGLQMEDLLDHLASDPHTRVIALFLESIRDGELFQAAVKKARANGKRLIAYTIGKSENGKLAVASHTGSLAGNQRLYEAVFRQHGISRAYSLDEFLDGIIALSWCQVPGGRRIAVISSSGASCGIAADDLEANGLTMPPLPAAVKAELSGVLPAFAGLHNPLDLTAEVITRPGLVRPTLEILLASKAYDALMITLGTNQGKTAMDVAEIIVDLKQRMRIPILLSRLGADSLGRELLAYYAANHIPVYSTPTRAAAALRHLATQSL